MPRRQRILEAAARLFRDRGYVGTSMRDLARAVDLQASSLYNHIQSKQQLLQEICFANARRYLQGIAAIEKEYTTAGEQLRALIRLHLDIATEDLTSVTAFNDEWRHLEEPQLTRFRELRREYEDRCRAIIRRGMQAGELAELDPQIVLYTLLSSLRWVHDWYRADRGISNEQLEGIISQILLQGLQVPGRQGATLEQP